MDASHQLDDIRMRQASMQAQIDVLKETVGRFADKLDALDDLPKVISEIQKNNEVVVDLTRTSRTLLKFLKVVGTIAAALGSIWFAVKDFLPPR